MKIEVLKREDIHLYKVLIDECFGSSNDLEKYKQYYDNQNYTIFVIKDEGAIVGSITQYPIDLFTFDFQPCLMIFNVAVKVSHRRQLIAKTLLDHVIENAKLEGYKSISLTCLDSAFSAHKLYESVGFLKTNSIKYSLDLNTTISTS